MAVARTLTYGLPFFEAKPQGRDSKYAKLLDSGHDHRPAAGLFDQTAQAMVELEEIDTEEVEELLDAIDEEVRGSGFPASVLYPELQQFYEEWAHRFTEEAEALVVETVGLSAPRAALGEGVARDVSALNGFFYEAAEDGIITRGEFEAIRQGLGNNRYVNSAYQDNLSRLYVNEDVTWRKNTMVSVRRAHGDEKWFKDADLMKALRGLVSEDAEVDEEIVERLIDTIHSIFPRSEGNTAVREALKRALKLGGFEDTFTARLRKRHDELMAYFDGDGDLEALASKIADKKKVTQKDVDALIEQTTWMGSGNPSSKLMAEAIAHISEQYFLDSRFSDEVVFSIDTAVLGEQAARRRHTIDELDFLGIVSSIGAIAGRQWEEETIAEIGEHEVTVRYDCRGGQQIEIIGLYDEVLRIRPGAQIELGTEPTDEISVSELLAHDELTEALRQLAHCALR